MLYPYLIKIVFAPFIDIYFNRKIGKCRTWILISTVLLFFYELYVASHGDSFINPANLNLLIFV